MAAVGAKTVGGRVYPEPYDPKTFSFLRRLKEIDMFFDRRDPVHQTAGRLARRLDRAGIPYVIMGAMAVNAHGARRTTDDVDVLLNETGLQHFREDFVGKWYAPVEGRSRRFIEKQSGVRVDILVTGGRPRFGQPTPLRFPEPRGVARVIEGLRYLKLPELIQLKLAA